MANARHSPIYFTSLELENVRCFGRSQPLDLTDGSGNPAQWTLLLGDNGVGKTTLLQCLSWMRPVPVQKPGYADDEGPESLKKGPLGPALQNEENDVLEALLRSGKAVELTLKAELSFNKALTSPNGTKKRVSRSKKTKKISTYIQLCYSKRKELQDYEISGTRIQTLGSFVEPLIVAYGASRHMERKNLDVTDLLDPIAARLGGPTELYDAEEILLRLDHAAAKKEYKPRTIENRRLEKLKETLARVLPNIQAADIEILAPKIEGMSQPSGVRFKTFSGLVPLSGLSLGYQTTLAWTTDLAWRLFRAYPKSPDPLAEPAIVIIDEIDLHLHPIWQRTIMDDLSEVFPSTQFIATAHSPLMVQSEPNANLAVVQRKGDEVVIENQPHVVESWRVDQILNSELFGLNYSRDKATEELFLEREKLLAKSRLSPAEKAKLRRLDKQVATLPTEAPEDEAALKFIRKAAPVMNRYKNR